MRDQIEIDMGVETGEVDLAWRQLASGPRAVTSTTLQMIAAGLTARTGGTFFESLVNTLAQVSGARHVMVGEPAPEQPGSVQTRALHSGGRIVDGITYELSGTPCENVLTHRLCVYPQNVVELFPDDPLLRQMAIESYAGVPLTDSSDRVIGLLVVLDDQPITDLETVCALLRIFAVRAAGELERLQFESQQRRMMAELDHRVKNTLASVLSLAEQTITESATLDDFRTRYLGRIRSLARAHEALSASRWRSPEIESIVRLAVGPAADHDGPRITAGGPQIRLPATTATPLGLTLHELATNALKHGAMSSPEGTIDITWRLDSATDEVHLTWHERGGPPIPTEPAEGLGLSLVRGFIQHELRGRTSLHFDPEGLSATLVIPLATG